MPRIQGMDQIRPLFFPMSDASVIHQGARSPKLLLRMHPEDSPEGLTVIQKLIAERIKYRGYHRKPYEQYQENVRQHYSGIAGKFLRSCSIVSLHEPLASSFFKRGAFPVQGCKNILDVGTGAGQLLTHLVRHADSDSRIVATDLSTEMLNRAAERFADDRIDYVTAALTELPFEDNTFDCATCGWVLEYLPDPEPGLREISRVIRPGGRILLQCTENTVFGAMSSRLWKCRTFQRSELQEECRRVGLNWQRELWFTKAHRLFRLGGIIV